MKQLSIAVELLHSMQDRPWWKPGVEHVPPPVWKGRHHVYGMAFRVDDQAHGGVDVVPEQHLMAVDALWENRWCRGI